MSYVQICPSMEEFNAVKDKLLSATGGEYWPVYLKANGTDDAVVAAVSEPELLVNLASTSAAGIYKQAPRPGVTGTLPIANGGTGLTASPSMTVDLESDAADDVMKAAPQPGVAGVLPVQHGGTGKITLEANAVVTGNAAGGVKTVPTGAGALYATTSGGAAQFGVLPIAYGGTGSSDGSGVNAGTATKLKDAHTIRTDLASENAVAFDGTSDVTPGVTGTLPVGHGGTGLVASPSMLTNLESTTAANVLVQSPRPGVTGILPAANGGTGNSSLQATRNAMGLGDTTGALPVANGGTGTATTTKNLVFASPSTTSGAPSFRSLVAGDLPTSGVVAG
ncbi:MAG: hypothetical protein IJ087_02645, partial [Eggerthellaceae bacterium]|nr:hypothetical protein [Eggerthellaceae bacterium]